MPTPSTQPTFDESEAISNDAALQKLLTWYPDQQALVLAAYRRRNPHPGCTCPWEHRRAGRCCIVDQLPPLPPRNPRYRRPSRRGQYREQTNK